MNENIRKNIDLINTNNIPQNYKKTSLGIVPKDWNEKKLGDIGVFSKGKGIPGYKMKKEGKPCIGYGDIYTKYKYYFNKACSFVDKSIAKKA